MMDSRYCGKCPHKLPLSCFLKDPSDPTSKLFSLCASCRAKAAAAATRKRKALQPLDPIRRPAPPAEPLPCANPPPLRPGPSTRIPTHLAPLPLQSEHSPVPPPRPDASLPTRPPVLPPPPRSEPSLRVPPPPVLSPHPRPEPPISRLEPALRVPPPPVASPHPRPEPPLSRPEPALRVCPPPVLSTLPRPEPPPPRPAQPAQPEPGFLPAEQWEWIQGFHTAMAAVEMETCSRCLERWFEMDLRHNVCRRCSNRDKGNKTPFLMSADNEMDPGELPAHLPELTQVEEMIIARSHVQMLVHRYRGHQYHYSGHCVSFMQNNVKTVDMLPNLPSELDIVVLRPSDQVMESDPRYRSQFRADFRVRRGHVLTWLRYLKANHPDYRYITISADRMDALPVDSDISSSFVTVVDDTSVEEPVPEQPVSGDLPLPTPSR